MTLYDVFGIELYAPFQKKRKLVPLPGPSEPRQQNTMLLSQLILNKRTFKPTDIMFQLIDYLLRATKTQAIFVYGIYYFSPVVHLFHMEDKLLQQCFDALSLLYTQQFIQTCRHG